jgi:TonB family protein
VAPEPKKETPPEPPPASEPQTSDSVREISLIEKDEMAEPSIEIELDKAPDSIAKEKEPVKQVEKVTPPPPKPPAPETPKPEKKKDPVTIDVGRDFFKEQPKRKSGFLFYLLAAIVVISIALYFIFIQKSSPSPADLAQNSSGPAKTVPMSKDSGLKIDQTGTFGVPIGKRDPNIPDTKVIPPESEKKKDPEPTEESTDATAAEEKTPPQVMKQEQKKEQVKEVQATPVENKSDMPVEKTATQSPETVPDSKSAPNQTDQKAEQDQTEEGATETTAEETTETSDQQAETPPVQEQPVQQIVQPAIKEGQVISINEVDIPPKPISTPTPKIPKNRFMRVTTTVVIRYLISHNGTVEKVYFIKKSSRKNVNDIIEKTIKKWKYKPAVKNNLKVKIWKTISFKVNQ